MDVNAMNIRRVGCLSVVNAFIFDVIWREIMIKIGDWMFTGNGLILVGSVVIICGVLAIWIGFIFLKQWYNLYTI